MFGVASNRVHEPLLFASKYDGFWMSMDTFKDKQLLDDLYSKGTAPWEVWKQNPDHRRVSVPPKLR